MFHYSVIKWVFSLILYNSTTVLGWDHLYWISARTVERWFSTNRSFFIVIKQVCNDILKAKHQIWKCAWGKVLIARRLYRELNTLVVEFHVLKLHKQTLFTCNSCEFMWIELNAKFSKSRVPIEFLWRFESFEFLVNSVTSRLFPPRFCQCSKHIFFCKKCIGSWVGWENNFWLFHFC